jgi:flagellar basal body P-ring formation protein FlgA
MDDLLRLSLTARACRALGIVRAWRAALALAFACSAAPVAAQGSLDPVLTQQLHQFTWAAARHQSPDHRIEVRIGSLDPRLRLAPCARAEPYLAGAARLWGPSRIGLRCVEGATRWNVFVPVTVKVFGTAAVAASPLPSGTVVAPKDLSQAEVDLAENASSTFADPARIAGRTLARAVPAGQAVREAHLKPRVWFAAGDEVRLISRGAGFAAIGTGQALNAGVEGQPARARTESGRVVIGHAVANKEIDLTR